MIFEKIKSEAMGGGGRRELVSDGPMLEELERQESSRIRHAGAGSCLSPGKVLN